MHAKLNIGKTERLAAEANAKAREQQMQVLQHKAEMERKMVFEQAERFARVRSILNPAVFPDPRLHTREHLRLTELLGPTDVAGGTSLSGEQRLYIMRHGGGGVEDKEMQSSLQKTKSYVNLVRYGEDGEEADTHRESETKGKTLLKMATLLEQLALYHQEAT